MVVMADQPDKLHDLVLNAARAGPLADAVRAVAIEPGLDEDNHEFLRVALEVNLPNGDVDAELEAMLERIEAAVANVDDRYASVRFLDAA